MSSWKHSDATPIWPGKKDRPRVVASDVPAVPAGSGFCDHEGCIAIVEGARQFCDEHAESSP